MAAARVARYDLGSKPTKSDGLSGSAEASPNAPSPVKRLSPHRLNLGSGGYRSRSDRIEYSIGSEGFGSRMAPVNRQMTAGDAAALDPSKSSTTMLKKFTVRLHTQWRKAKR